MANDNMAKTGAISAVILRGILDMALLALLVSVLALTMPLYLMQVYDRVIPASSEATLFYLTLLAIAAMSFNGLFEVLRSLYAQRLSTRIDRAFGSDAFVSSLASRDHTGDTQALSDLTTLRSFCSSKALTSLFDLPFVPIFLAMLYLVHPMLAGVTLAGIIVLVVVMLVTQLATRRSTTVAANHSVRSARTAMAFVRNADTLRAMGMTPHAVEAWGTQFAAYLSANARATVVGINLGGIAKTLRSIIQLAIMSCGAYLVLQGSMMGGMIFASSILSGRVLQPLDQLVGAWRQITDARLAYTRLAPVFRERPAHSPSRLTLPDPTGAISVRDLVYVSPTHADGKAPIIKRVNLEIAAGETIAIVGASGAGKSTLLRLLAGAIEATSGAIAFDNADISTWGREQLGSQLGYLAQDVQLFPGTIAQNVARFDPDARDADIVAAAQMAHAHELIVGQPAGYATQVGDTLSGGERQRIGLARAFYGNPRLLMLDEPNANLDDEGEVALRAAIGVAKQAGKTVVIVTHRMGVVTCCDRVLTMSDGEVVGDTAGTVAAQVTGRPANEAGNSIKVTRIGAGHE